MQQKQKRRNKRKGTLLALLLVVVVALGSSLAIFTDVFTFDQDFTAGTLELENVDNSIALSPFSPGASLTNMAPGDVFKLVGQLKNNGSLDAKVRVTLVEQDPVSGDWAAIDTSATPTSISAGQTVDLSALTTPLTIQYLLGLAGDANMNDQQGAEYTYEFRVEAMQDRNTTGADWSTVTVLPVNP